jgi:adenosylcobinamide-phosphate synthase
VLTLAILIDAALGDPAWLRPHPVVLAGRFIAQLDAKLNRPSLRAGARRMRGVLAVALLAALSLTIGWLSHRMFAALPLGWLLEALALAILLAGRSLYDAVARVADALDRGGIEAGREAVSHIIGRDPKLLDEHGVARGAIESGFENFSDGLVGPVFWYALLGLPGACLYKAVNTADSMLGHRTWRHGDFGWATARLDDALNLLPARLSALLIAAAALLLRDGDAAGALRAASRDAGKHKSINAGWPEAAAAGALGLRLNGPKRYWGELRNDAWMGDGRAEATSADVRRALALYRRAWALLGALALLGMLT